jgi:hypothetical protein
MTTRNSVSRALPMGLALGLGLLLGWALAGGRVKTLQARVSNDRFGDTIVTTGVIQQESSMAIKGVVPQEAVYYLNYKTGLLMASVPTPRVTPQGTEFLGEFAERDLVADFGLKPGDAPHFLMTTAQVGSRSEGWEPLFVFDTNSGQVATYRIKMQATPTSTKPVFQLLERHADPRLGRGVGR